MSKSKKVEFKLSDQVIGQLRELLQVSMIMGVNFVDQVRALRLQTSDQSENILVLTPEYVDGWNEMAERKLKEATELKTKEAEVLEETKKIIMKAKN